MEDLDILRELIQPVLVVILGALFGFIGFCGRRLLKKFDEIWTHLDSIVLKISSVEIKIEDVENKIDSRIDSLRSEIRNEIHEMRAEMQEHVRKEMCHTHRNAIMRLISQLQEHRKISLSHPDYFCAESRDLCKYKTDKISNKKHDLVLKKSLAGIPYVAKSKSRQRKKSNRNI